MELIIGDGSLGLPTPAKEAFPQSKFQTCLWHLCQDVLRKAQGLDWRQRQLFKDAFREVFNAPTLEECFRFYLKFLRHWGLRLPYIAYLLARYEDYLFNYYAFPVQYHPRLRTNNLVESFFSHLQKLLNQFLGVSSEEQIDLIIGLLWQRFNAYRSVHNSRQYQSQESSFIYAYYNFNTILLQSRPDHLGCKKGLGSVVK